MKSIYRVIENYENLLSYSYKAQKKITFLFVSYWKDICGWQHIKNNCYEIIENDINKK